MGNPSPWSSTCHHSKVLFIPYLLHFLVLHNKLPQTSNLSKNYLLSHSFNGSKVQEWVSWLLCLGYHGLKLGCHPCVVSFWRFWERIHSQDHLGCQLSSVPCDYGTEVSIFMLAIIQGPLSAPRSLPYPLPHAFSIQQRRDKEAVQRGDLKIPCGRFM